MRRLAIADGYIWEEAAREIYSEQLSKVNMKSLLDVSNLTAYV